MLQLATKNHHKVAEVTRYLKNIQVTALPESVKLPPETGETYAENALGKARAAAQATGLVTVADDSGIESEYLDGKPGVRSARFAGGSATDGENLKKLIEEVPPGTGLRYVCVVACVDPESGEEETFTGTCSGKMAKAPRGSNGFGYDPVFLPDAYAADRLTAAELTAEQKDSISHRGEALSKLSEWLEAKAG